MPILIDGHNLVPKIRGLRLSDPNDETRLISLLQEYARRQRAQIECCFDRAPAGQPLQQRHGTLAVRFARPGLNADEEIRLRLEELGKQARSWTVVSSDQRVQTYARWAGAQVQSSETFAAALSASLSIADSNRGSPQAGAPAPKNPKAPRKTPSAHSKLPAEKRAPDERGLTPKEVEEWLELFRQRKK